MVPVPASRDRIFHSTANQRIRTEVERVDLSAQMAHSHRGDAFRMHLILKPRPSTHFTTRIRCEVRQ